MGEASPVLTHSRILDIVSGPAPVVASALVAVFETVSRVADKVRWVQRHIAEELGGALDQTLDRACAAIASTIDADAELFDRQPYHNRQHYCEVALTVYALCLLKQVDARETQLLVLAAFIHDFVHDGGPHGPFEQERASVERVLSVLEANGVDSAQMRRLTVLVLATDPARGTAFTAAACRTHDGRPGDLPSVPEEAPELAELLDDPALARLTLTLCEADVLPSVGLTLEHSLQLQARLALEWARPLGLHDKLRFIDAVLAQGFISEFFLPNVQATRAAVARAANVHA